MNYIVCSYGGSGSWMLVNYLKNYGNSYHIHQRNPPKELTYPDAKREKFSNDKISINELKNYKVIFIYKNPIKAIYSRFDSEFHLRNIESKELNPNAIFNVKRDLFGITEYYNNYTKPNGRNYDIYCVKYEDFFNKIEEFNKVLELKKVRDCLPIKKETSRKELYYSHLFSIYENLIEDQNKRNFIELH